MKKYLPAIFLYALFLSPLSVFAQLPGNWAVLQKLKTERDSIMASPEMRERMTGLVQVGLTDSILQTKVATHQTRIFNWVLRTFAGLRWRAIDGKKHSMVGTMQGGFSSPGKDFFTEYDITFQMFQHTPEYLELVREAYQTQYDKMLKGRNFLKKKGIYPDSLTLKQLSKMRIHPEHTPLKKNRAILNEYFLPCLEGCTIENHPSWGISNPTVGVYGAFVLDGNHKGSPEIHPYEWLWWMDAKEKRPNVTKWYAGLLREGSNRFLKWSKSPRVGFISIPFVFNVNDSVNTIRIEHLVKGIFKPEGLQKLSSIISLGAKKIGNENYRDITIIMVPVDQVGEKTKLVETQTTIRVVYDDLKTDGVVWWINLEGRKGDVAWGYITIAVSVDDAYCFSVTVED